MSDEGTQPYDYHTADQGFGDTSHLDDEAQELEERIHAAKARWRTIKRAQEHAHQAGLEARQERQNIINQMRRRLQNLEEGNTRLLEWLNQEETRNHTECNGRNWDGPPTDEPPSDHPDESSDDSDEGPGDNPGNGPSDSSDDSSDESEQGEPAPRRPRRQWTVNQGPINPHIPAPPKFDAKMMLPWEWINHMDAYFRSINKTSGWVDFTILYLRNNPLAWWNNLHVTGTAPRNWQTFSAAIIQQFEPIDAVQKARNEIRYLKQTTAVADYVMKFKNIWYQIPDMNEAEAFDKFWDGLKPAIKMAIDREEIISGLDHLMTWATCHDEILFGQKMTPRSDFKKPEHHHHKKEWHKKVDAIETKDIECYNCGKKGHMAKDCRGKRNPNAKTKPHWKKDWKPKKDDKTDKPTVNLIQVPIWRLDEDVVLPVHKTEGSAGADLTPNQDGEILPWTTVKVPTGLAAQLQDNYFFKVIERSNIHLLGLQVSGVIDADYRNEIFLIIYNGTPEMKYYRKGGKAMAQMITIPYEKINYVEVKELIPTNQTGGFGSTDINTIKTQPGRLEFKGSLNKKKAIILIDSGADGMFIGENLAKECGIKTTLLKTPTSAIFANGEVGIVTKEARNIPYQIQGLTGIINL
jgi:dUTP pyrophosphatase